MVWGTEAGTGRQSAKAFVHGFHDHRIAADEKDPDLPISFNLTLDFSLQTP
jgi:hypothetical protein